MSMYSSDFYAGVIVVGFAIALTISIILFFVDLWVLTQWPKRHTALIKKSAQVLRSMLPIGHILIDSAEQHIIERNLRNECERNTQVLVFDVEVQNIQTKAYRPPVERDMKWERNDREIEAREKLIWVCITKDLPSGSQKILDIYEKSPYKLFSIQEEYCDKEEYSLDAGCYDGDVDDIKRGATGTLSIEIVELKRAGNMILTLDADIQKHKVH